MKTKILSLLLLTLGWSPSMIWFYADVFSQPITHSGVSSEPMQWLCMVILPGAGGLLAGWAWRAGGLLVALLYVVSAAFATPIYMSWVSSWKLPPGVMLEGPTGILLLAMAVPGTGVALVASLLGMLAHSAANAAKAKQLQQSD